MYQKLYNTLVSDRLITSQHRYLLDAIIKVGALSFLIYGLFVYFAFSKGLLSLLNLGAFFLFFITYFDYSVNQNFSLSSSLSSLIFSLFFGTLLYLTENRDITLFGTILVPVFVFSINGRVLGSLYTAIFLAFTYTLSYQGISVWNDGTFSYLSYTHYVAATLILVLFIYFIERSYDNYVKVFHKQNSQLKEAQKIANIGSWEWDIQNGELQWSDETFNMFNFIQGKDEPS